MGEAIYVDIPGVSTHELPPLLVRGVPEGTLPREQVVELATEIVDVLQPEDAQGTSGHH